MNDIMDSSIQERENTLKILEKQLYQISNTCRKSYLKKGRGALVVHTFLLERNHKLSSIDYNNKDESLDLFNNENSRRKLEKLIDNYDPKTEGILILITKTSATWFITAKLKSRQKIDSSNN